MLFAAGLGTRLGEYTKNTPKALVQIKDKPLIEYSLEYLKKYGVTDVIINVHHFADKIINHINNINTELNITFSHEKELLETGGGLLKAKNFFSDVDDFILYNTDILTSLDLHKMYEKFRKTDSLACLAVRKRETSRYLLFDEKEKMQGWENTKTGEKILCNQSPEKLNQYAFSGIHIVSTRIFDLLKEKENQKFSITKAYIELACKENITAYIDNSAFWVDAGKPEIIENLNKKTIDFI